MFLDRSQLSDNFRPGFGPVYGIPQGVPTTGLDSDVGGGGHTSAAPFGDADLGGTALVLVSDKSVVTIARTPRTRRFDVDD
ncbi:hypothetical protein [Nocardia bovistercoris]|uniref:Uncharacterized protein n=1 Tax=Nocardia bovistercoris TaxID=2785916 RepID=A0A931ICH4_9NOCA|nr:hypothetical protein [Nocardia bovistercoris]MBH0778006.1 hypothetical protein [Nocardia bovistercoris]